MGLLDGLMYGNQDGVSGLLNSLLYQSPLKRPDDVQQPQYDPMGNYTGITPQTPNPFGPLPQMSQPSPGQFAPQSPFNGGAAPVAGLPPAQAPVLPPPQEVAPAPQAAAPQDMPIGNMNIGGYQMPQFGSAQDYAPSTTPANAQPAQGQLPSAAPQQAQAQPAFLQPPNQGGFGGAFRGMAANAQAGPLGMIMGGIGGAMGMGRGNPEDIKNQNLNAQFQSLKKTLIDDGDTEQKASSKAMFAVMNPEAAKTILPELFTNRAELKTIRGIGGAETPMVWDPIAHTLVPPTDANGKPISSQGAQETYDNIAKARDQGATHDQLYQMVPSTLRAGVQAMIEGKGIPTNLSARGDERNAAILLAHTIDPTFDESQINARVQGNKDFYGGGKSAETMRKTNQSALHFGELVDKMQTLPGGPVPAANAVGNFINSELLGKSAKGNFIVNGHALADELSSMFKGAGISDTEIRAWESNLSPDMSQEQQRGMAKTLLGLYRDSVSALEKKRLESVGPVVAAQKGPILGPEAQAALAKVEQFSRGGSPAASVGGIPPGWSVKVH